MSSALRPIEDSAPLALTEATLEALTERPLLALPPVLRPAVFQTWVLYRHVAGMDTPAPLAFAVTAWVNTHRISAARITDALEKLTHPHHMREIRFTSDLLTHLAGIIKPPETHEERMRRLMAEASGRRFDVYASNDEPAGGE